MRALVPLLLNKNPKIAGWAFEIISMNLPQSIILSEDSMNMNLYIGRDCGIKIKREGESDNVK